MSDYTKLSILLLSLTVSHFSLADSTVVNFTGNVKKSPCTIDSTNYNIDLGEWSTGDFPAIGTTTTSKALDIVLNCPSSDIAVTAQIIGTADTSQTGTVKLTQTTDSATGLGIQLINESNTPLAINSNFILSNAVTNKKISLSWKARYIQTSSTVTSGSANGVVNVSFTYN